MKMVRKLRTDYLKRLKKIRKGRYIGKFSSIEELRKMIEE